jgi:hypothetical protein
VSAAVAVIDAKVDGLESLYEEKFQGVGTRFNELNTRLTEGDRYKQTALDAALKAAQTLVDIQNVNFKETIKKTEELFGKQIGSLQQSVDDLKGEVRQRAGATSQQGTTGALIFSVLGVMGVMAIILLDIFRH